MNEINFVLKSHDFSFSALTKWILSTCVNIHHLQIEFLEKPNGFLKSIARLKNLKKLDVAADRARDLKGVTMVAFKIIPTLLISS